MRVTSALLLPGLAAALPQPSPAFEPKPGNFPATGDGDVAGGIFSISLPSLSWYLLRNGGLSSGPEAVSGNFEPTHGTGPYPAQMFTDPKLKGHTIYAPITPIKEPVPFVNWGNGACGNNGAGYKNMLLEIASHGYIIAADGDPTNTTDYSGLGLGIGASILWSQSKVQDARDAVEWALTGGADKYGIVDPERIATAGHSCGGLEAMSLAYQNPKIKRVFMFNIAIFQDDRRYLLEKVTQPVTYIMGGPKDMGYPNAEKDYDLLPKSSSVYKANLDTGHMGTFAATNGGKEGKAAVTLFNWQLRNDVKAKAAALDPKAPDSLVSQGWNVTYRNWN